MKAVFQAKIILYCGQTCLIVCDGRCDKAWGINNRPRKRRSDDLDDYVFSGDDEIGQAPADPGTYEGDHAKPAGPGDFNKWCVRECERTSTGDPGEVVRPPDMVNPQPNLLEP